MSKRASYTAYMSPINSMTHQQIIPHVGDTSMTSDVRLSIDDKDIF